MVAILPSLESSFSQRRSTTSTTPSSLPLRRVASTIYWPSRLLPTGTSPASLEKLNANTVPSRRTTATMKSVRVQHKTSGVAPIDKGGGSNFSSRESPMSSTVDDTISPLTSPSDGLLFNCSTSRTSFDITSMFTLTTYGRKGSDLEMLGGTISAPPSATVDRQSSFDPPFKAMQYASTSEPEDGDDVMTRATDDIASAPAWPLLPPSSYVRIFLDSNSGPRFHTCTGRGNSSRGLQ
mmetsp:Transcript_24939/g.59250  ORF Transcript_24939/g.59250 Transcript_24939/m.59250 type:complete len:237 (+) Transcript_24939:110-820(+)